MIGELSTFRSLPDSGFESCQKIQSSFRANAAKFFVSGHLQVSLSLKGVLVSSRMAPHGSFGKTEVRASGGL